MWFKMSSELFEERIFKLCEVSSGRGDHNASSRILILIQIFNDSADKMFWKTAPELASLIKRPTKEVQRVWDLCISEGVLRNYETGFNALEYMKEKKIIGDVRTSPAAPSAPDLAMLQTASTNSEAMQILDSLRHNTKNFF